MPVLAVLSFVVLVAALAVASRWKSRAEALIVASVVAQAIVLFPIFVLGLLNVLDRVTLGIVTSTISVGILGIVARRRGRDAVRDTLQLARRIVLLPFTALRVALAARSLVAIGVVLTVFLLGWLAASVYLAPAWRDWDALWYHEPIAAFAIQNHGFRPIELPPYLQGINSFHRVGEMTQLWFAIYAGRRLVDAANLVTCPLLIAATYALAHSFTKDRVSSVGWAAAIFLVPANVRLVQSTMVDPQSAALLLAAAYFVLHPKLTTSNVIVAILSLTLAVGAKIWSLVPVGVLSLVFLGRLIAERRALGLRRTLELVFGGALLMAAMMSFTYVRNLILFKNPFWPVLSYENATLGIHWKGGIPVNLSASRAGIDFNEPYLTLFKRLLALPFTTTTPVHAWQVDDFGFGVSWLVLPLGGIAAALAILRAFWGSVAMTFRLRAPVPADFQARRAAVAGATALASLILSPALHIARYHIASLALLGACIAWLSSSSRTSRAGDRTRLAEGAAVFAILTAAIMHYWAPRKAPHLWFYEPAELVKMAKIPYPRREVDVPWEQPRMLLSPVVPATGIAREQEIKKDDVVAFDAIDFVALLFNNDYSNKVVAVMSADPLAEAEAAHAVWIYTRAGTTLDSQLTKAAGWERVGALEAERFGTVWRRKR